MGAESTDRTNSAPREHGDGGERPEAQNVEARMVAEQRDAKSDQERVGGWRARPKPGEGDERDRRDGGDLEVVGLVHDPVPGEAQPVAKVGEETSGAAADRVRDVARAARKGVDP